MLVYNEQEKKNEKKQKTSESDKIHKTEFHFCCFSSDGTDNERISASGEIIQNFFLNNKFFGFSLKWKKKSDSNNK